MGYNYDKTKSNIGDLDSSEQKEMFKKFRDSGGEIIKEKTDRPKSGGGGGGAGKAGGSGRGVRGGVRESKLPSEMARDKARAEADKQNRARASIKAQEALISNFWSRMQIQFKAMIGGVSGFGSRKLKAKFLYSIADRTKRALMEMNILGSDLFHRDPTVGRQISDDLDNQSYMYTEVLDRGAKVYSSEFMDPLVSLSQANPAADVELSGVRDHLGALYRELYYIYPHYNTYLKAAQLGIDAQTKHANMPSSNQSDKAKKIRRDVNYLFTVLFPKLHIAICKADGKLYPEMSRVLENAIGVDPERKLTNMSEEDIVRGRQENKEEIEQAKAEEAQEKEEAKAAEEEIKEEDYPKEIRYGLSLMRMYRLDQLRKKHDPQGVYDKLPYTDKILLTYLYMAEFDFEYSFVLTTNKIKLNVDYTGGIKKDTHQQLRDIYDTLRNSNQHMKAYFAAFEEMEELKKNPSSNYIQQSKNIASCETKRGHSGRNFRGSVMDSMQKIGQALMSLINDMKNDRKIVGNMDEQLKFDARVEGRKRLNGKKVSQCIMEGYCYASALAERLESGDLYGGVIDLNEDEFTKSFGIEQYQAFVQGTSDPGGGAPAPGSGDVDIPEPEAGAGETAEPEEEESDEIHELDEDIDISGGLDDEL